MGPLHQQHLQQQLQHAFGFSQFRPGQQQVVETVLDGRNCAAIFPTGSGKSLCYQLPALSLPHLTLVISPLLALMQDQLDFLHQHHIPAASIDSSKSREEINATMNGIKQGEIKLLMISVERFKNERFRHFLQQIPLSLMVVDEAHCISEWGHNFRPDYLKLPQYQAQFNIPQVLLLTATATPKVMTDMKKKFAIHDDDLVVTGFYRPNLFLGIRAVEQSQKIPLLSDYLQKRPDEAAIIYVTLQKTAEEVAQQLSQAGIHASAYHAGMPHEQRDELQQAFMKGQCQVIVATIAFGMGIDKSNIRHVVHYDLPKSIENYSQEIGRAGRDGQRAFCLVLANKDSLNVLENFVYGDTPELSGITQILEEIKAQPQQWEVMLTSLSNQAGIRQLPLKTLLVYLEMHGIIAPLYSYYADYRFKLLMDEGQLLERFDPARQQFIQQIFSSAQKSRIWYSADFDALLNQHGGERERAIKALDYLHEQGLITLESKQMTEVYQINNRQFDPVAVAEQLQELFLQKEQSEIKRIAEMIKLFESRDCISQRLAGYFGDHQLTAPCGHCTVCRGEPATLPQTSQLTPLTELPFDGLTAALIDKLPQPPTSTLITRFLCGITTPQLTRIRARSLSGFSHLENYRYAEVKDWVEQHQSHNRAHHQ